MSGGLMNVAKVPAWHTLPLPAPYVSNDRINITATEIRGECRQHKCGGLYHYIYIYISI